jgi:DNA repair protein RadD
LIYEERQYQIDCEDALLRDILAGYNPVTAIPTGGGKTKIMGGLTYKYLEKRPSHRVMLISNTEEILKQDHTALKEFFPGIIIGLYSSGLKSKVIQKITIVSVQSAFRKPELFKNFNLVICDEAHTIPTKKNSMYRKLFSHISKAQFVGLSATIYRTGQGYIHKGEGALFNKLSYDLTSMEEFNKLTDD